jgi:natural product biosynthesis luciferase-like monooxygenase protein
MPGFETFNRLDQVIRFWAEQAPEKNAITYLKNDCETDGILSYRILDAECRRIAAVLASHKLAGERAILLFDGDNHFITAFLSCLYARVIAVPVFKPQRKQQHWAKVENIVRDCGASVVIGTDETLEKAADFLTDSATLAGLTRVSITDHGQQLPLWQDAEGRPDDIAFLQYTSGSTGDPKGVIVTHGNLLHNELQLRQVFGHSEQTTIVSWLPLFHDMGLIGMLLQCLYTGGSYYYMTPVTFLQKPSRWLQAISQFRANTSGAPNFAYELCIGSVTDEQLQALDLSCWQLAFSGAEPVKADTMQRFSQYFAGSGFVPEAFYPCYGMAECTLFATGASKSDHYLTKVLDPQALQQDLVQISAQHGATTLVALGSTHLGQQVVIADPDTGRALGENAIGEIWLKGDSICQGYWQRPEQSIATFGNTLYLADGQTDGPYLKTGDRGFLSDGQLYFTGRLKELIIIRGRNYYPQDLEAAIQSQVLYLRAGCGAAAMVMQQGEEAVVVVQEISRHAPDELDLSSLSQQIRQVIAADFNLSLLDVVLIKPGQLPKTSSGKIQRTKCAELYLNGEWTELALVPLRSKAVLRSGSDSAAALQTFVRHQLSQLMHCTEADIDLTAPFAACGIDSLRLIRLQQQVSDQFDIEFDTDDLFSDDSVQAVCEKYQNNLSGGSCAVSNFEAAESPERAALTLNQHSLLFLHQLAPDSPAYHLPLAVQLEPVVHPKHAWQCFTQVLRGEQICAVRISTDEQAQPLQQWLAAVEPQVELLDARLWSDNEYQQFLHDFVSQPLPLMDCPLYRAAVLNRSQGPVLLFVVHHIVSDLWSLAGMIKRLAAALSGHSLPVATSWSYLQAAAQQQHYLQSTAAEQDWQYWQSVLSNPLPVLAMPQDKPGDQLQPDSAGYIDFRLDAALCSSLNQFARTHKVQLSVVLLTAYSLLLHRLSQQQDLLIGMPTAGQRQGRLADCHGYFVEPVLIRSTITAQDSALTVLAAMKKQLAGAIRHSRFPLQRIIERLNPNRQHAGPVFSAMFSYNLNPDLPQAGDFVLAQPSATVQLSGIGFSVVSLPVPAVQTDFSLQLSDVAQGITARLIYRSSQYEPQTIASWVQSYLCLLAAMTESAATLAEQLPLVNGAARDTLIRQGTGPRLPLAADWQLSRQILQLAKQKPEQAAIIEGSTVISYRQLAAQVCPLSHALRAQGVGLGDRVGVYMDKAPAAVICLLAVMAAGAAYVPLDPAYPLTRLQDIAEDAGLTLMLGLAKDQPAWQGKLSYLAVDQDWQAFAQTVPDVLVSASDLAYLIYTSGSTGKPKGVPISHLNVQNLLLGLDDKLAATEGSRLYTVTSISFDISVLELFWTLSRGLTVVFPVARAEVPAVQLPRLSLMYFAADENQHQEQLYQLVLEGAKKADQLGFDSVWLPERHFHSFGAAFPNPSVVAAAVAAVTKQIQIRAGSVVLPLHHPARVAEEWAVVDVMSAGRVGIAFASGWHPDDFLFRPQDYANRKVVMSQRIGEVRALWRGEPMTFTNGLGEPATVVTRPRPVQKELPVWITAAGNIETFKEAGRAGFNLLTHMLGQNIHELAEKVAAYRQARAEAGFDLHSQCVTVMLHTYVCADEQLARQRVEQPFKAYLKSSVELMRPLAQSLGLDPELNQELLVQHAFERYYGSSALFGTPDSCRPLLQKLKAMGVDEVACLIDFGVDTTHVLAGLDSLAGLLKPAYSAAEQLLHSLHSLKLATGITHLQCTPGYARLLAADPAGQQVLAKLQVLMLGGEPVPASLVTQLQGLGCRQVLNMYGPTETTVWSAVQVLAEQQQGYALIDGPLPNTRLYVVDAQLQLLPAGVVGELAIAGQGLSSGYWQLPEKTAEVFVSNPFEPGERLYLTGDLVKRCHDGALVFVARKDTQCKIGGHRIEIGEIEYHLQQLCETEAAVAVVSQGTEDYLCAFVVARSQPVLDLHTLRSQLALRLPAYMVPVRFELLTALPRTPNGKVDRKALLAALQQPQQLAARITAAASTAVQRQLLRIWQQLLQQDQISIHDNFFEIGGHSLMLPRLQNLIAQELSQQLDVVDLLQYPTISALSRFFGADQLEGQQQLLQGNQSRASKKKAAMQRSRVRREER